MPASSSTRQRTADTARDDGYPWRRVLFSCLVVFLCWGIGLYFEYQSTADARLKQAQDWAFAKLWTHTSALSASRVDPYRGPLWSTQVRGTVLELGPGLGEALLLLPLEARKHHYVALEPNMYLHSGLANNARQAGYAVHYDLLTCADAPSHNTDGEGARLAIVNGTLDEGIPRYVADHAPYDTVVSSLVLCSVRDLQGTLDRVQALLAPGGRFVFVEHVRHTDESDTSVAESGELRLALWRRIQDVVSPVWALVAGNCHVNRRSGQALDAMGGWKEVRYKTVRRSESIVDRLAPLVYGSGAKVRFQCPSSIARVHPLSQIRQFPPLEAWLLSLGQQRALEVTQAEIQSVDVFSDDRIGFVKLSTDARSRGQRIPGIVFLRGPSAAALVILRTSQGERVASHVDRDFMVLVEQPRVAVASSAVQELPAGMASGEPQLAAAVREVFEETGISVEERDLILLNPQPLYPSPGACDEDVRLFACEKHVTAEELARIQGRAGGLAGEPITVRLVRICDAWRAASDMKLLAALYLWDRRK
ncbi:hypothetical protein GGI20_004911 [Coemansia sp. BCRC 34301]|nr:hypothetical protein GGI20_004911 [Coemansia sp. BCRC 34301]